MMWIELFLAICIGYTVYKAVLQLLKSKNIKITDKTRSLLSGIVIIVMAAGVFIYEDKTTNQIKDGHLYYVNLFSDEKSQKNYRVPGLIYTSENGYILAYVKWSNGGETTFDNNYENLKVGKKIKIQDDEDRTWFAELTKEEVSP